MLKRLVTVWEFVKTSTFLTPDKVNLDLDIDNALLNYSSLNEIDQTTIRLQQYLDQAGNQVNSLSNNQIYNMWDFMLNAIENPDPIINTSDNIKIYQQNINTIKYVIIKWVEVFIQTSQLFADATTPAPSNLDIMIEGKSDNANIEITRLDLINTLNTTFFFRKVDSFGDVEEEYKNKFDHLYEDIDIGSQTWTGIRFKNGYLVKDVDYLGLDNKERLDRLQPSITAAIEGNKQNTINIKQLQDLTNSHTRDITTLKQKTQQNTDYIVGFYNQYTQYTTQNDKNIQDINNKLSSLSGGLNYVGIWNQLTTYSRGNVVSYNNKFYASNIDNNLGISPENNPTQWTKLPSIEDAQVDEKVNALRQELQPQITTNANDIITNKNSIVGIGLDIEELREGWNTTNSQVETNTEDIKTLRQDQSDLGDHITEEVNRLEDEIKNVTIDTSNLAKLNENNLFVNVKNVLRYDWDDSAGRTESPLIIEVELADSWRKIIQFETVTPGITFYDPTSFSSQKVELSHYTYDGGFFTIKSYYDYLKKQPYRFYSDPQTILDRNDDDTKKMVLNVEYMDKRYALKNEVGGGNFLKLDTQDKQEVQGPVNFSNLTVNNDRVLTTSDLGDTGQFVTTNTPQTITAAKTFQENIILVNKAIGFNNGTNTLNLDRSGAFLHWNGNQVITAEQEQLNITGKKNFTIPPECNANVSKFVNNSLTPKWYVQDMLKEIPTPTGDNWAANKSYVDSKLTKLAQRLGINSEEIKTLLE